MFEPLSTSDLRDLVAALGAVEVASDDAGRVDQLEALERVKSAVSAAQARITVELDRSLAVAHPDRSVGAQVGLARRESPHAGRRHLGLARALLDLPETMAALARGDISERRAEIVASETQDLSRVDRLVADAEIAGAAGGVGGLGDVRLQRWVRRVVMRLDEASVLRRRARAQAGRHVSGRLLPDGMAQICAVVPDVQYAAVMHSLRERAALLRASGDDRSRSQVMADELVARLTNQVTATASPVEVSLVVSAETLLAGDSTPADLAGVGPIPASVARALVTADEATRVTVRRLFAFPETDRLVAMESGRREFGGLLRRFVVTRDQLCRTPWCNAPVRHADHVEGVQDGGLTSAVNGEGLCETCNYVKEAIGWRHRPPEEHLDEHVVTITTPTGQVHESRPPGLPVPPARPVLQRSPLEIRLAEWMLVA